MIYGAYNTLLVLSLPLVVPYILLKDRRIRGTSSRLGGKPPMGRQRPEAGQDHPLWFHAASVGEVNMALPLMDAVHRRFPHFRLYLSTMTETGQQAAARLLEGKGTTFFLPLDFPWTVSRILGSLAPRALFVAETEIWPNLLRQCRRRRIPVVLFNGRISDRSFERYRRFRFFFREVIQGFAALAMQSGRDAERIIEIGASPSRVRVTGNVKFDRPIPRLTAEEAGALRAGLGIKEKQRVFVAGSTHRGEEELVLEAFRRLKQTEPSLVLILAPRHLERLGEAIKALDRGGLCWTRKSQISRDGPRADAVLLDTMGELGRIYGIGDVVFVGGSLVPVGGHNILEPAAFGKPVLFGPHMENFREVARIIKAEGGGIEIRDQGQLFEETHRLLTDRSYYRRVGRAALRTIRNNQGASQKTLEIFEKYLKPGDASP